MRGFIKVLVFATGILCFGGSALAQVKRSPDSAFDITQNRYLMVWEEVEGSGSVIKAQLKNPDGTNSGSEALISDPRPTQGCFYGQFDEQNGDITTPSDCPENKNPSVAYNNGQYLISWEVHGSANAPSSAPDNQFINIFAQVVNADTLEPLPGWEEGILISKVYIAANNAESSCGDKHACNDGQIQAWSKSKNADVVPNLFGQGFMVTWQTNKDYIGCADAERRGGWAVYGRYIDENFSATSTTNPPAFSVFKDDSTMADFCEPLSNVDNGTAPRIAVNQTSGDFVIAFEVARASGGNASIGAKRVTLGDGNVGEVAGSLMPSIVASVSGSSLNGVDVISFKDHYTVFASDGSGIRAKNFTSDAIASTEPAAISLGNGSKINPRGSSNLGIGGQRGGGANTSPERILLAFEKEGNIFVSLLDEALEVVREPQSISSEATDNQFSEISSDIHDYLVSWQGNDSEITVFSEIISSEDGVLPTPTASPNVPPTAPGLVSPGNSVTYAPTRAYLSWNASSDSDGGTVTYNVYFGEGAIPATPQVTGVTDTHFVIGPETEADTGITLEASTSYSWKIEADDGQGGLTSSPVRTLNTDNSVVAWWRFDTDPAGPVCAGGVAGETVCDASGLNNHAVPTGTPTWLPPPAAGILLGAIDFDGVNDKLEVQNDVSLNIGAGMAVSCKIRPQSVSTNTEIISKDNPASGPYSVSQTSTDTLVFGIFTSGTYKYAIGNIGGMIGADFRFIGNYNGTVTELYLGDVLAQSTPTAGTVTNNSNLMKIGFSVFNNSYYDGIMDECFLLNRSIGGAERTNIANCD